MIPWENVAPPFLATSATPTVCVLRDHSSKPLDNNVNDESNDFIALRCFMKLCVFFFYALVLGGDKIVTVRDDVKGIRNCDNKPSWLWLGGYEETVRR